mmetsp:Transcript_23091/g.53808  ORF Transcript_23091/g.53808 Transcript_23091/m.53808 type:complete len:91 (+) Transcript_23091:686-958(+)
MRPLSWDTYALEESLSGLGKDGAGQKEREGEQSILRDGRDALDWGWRGSPCVSLINPSMPRDLGAACRRGLPMPEWSSGNPDPDAKYMCP